MMRIKTLELAFIAIVSCVPSASPQQNSEPKQTNKVISTLAKKIEACPAAEQVAQFREKWVKVAWGPVRDVRYKVENLDSGGSAYKSIIEFSVPYSNGEHRDTRAEAERDKTLTQLFLSPVRYELDVSNDGVVSVKSMRIQNTFSGKWDDYAPSNPERFCWLTAVQKSTK